MTASLIKARVDLDGRMVMADPPLLKFHLEAGLQLRQCIAMPQLAQLVARALQSQRPVQRTIFMGREGGQVSAQAAIMPDEQGADIRISQWRDMPCLSSRHSHSPLSQPLPTEWRWECNAELKLLALHRGEGAPAFPQPWQGRLLLDVFDLHSDPQGRFPLLQGRSALANFDGQRISLNDRGRQDMLLSGQALWDGQGQFCGYRGVAEPADPADFYHKSPVDPAAIKNKNINFSRRVDQALRAPIGRIITYADQMAAPNDDNIRADYRRYARDMAGAGRHLLALVDDLTEMQNIESADFRTSVEPMDLADITRRTVSLMAIKARSKDIQLHGPQASARLPSDGDSRRVMQILMNLLGNAIRYSPNGSSIHVGLERSDNFAFLTVSDQGEGIPADQQSIIFDKFERLGRRGDGGSGLGLYISRQLARAMGGDLSVKSIVGEGAHFTLSLPLIR